MTHKGTETIETERLILRRFTLDDTDAMHRNWASDPDVTKHLTWLPHENIEVTRQQMVSLLPKYEEPQFYEWAIVPKDMREPIGGINVVRMNADTGSMTVAYRIGKDWWRRGYASEAFRAIIAFLFEEVGAKRIEASHASENLNSGKVMLKCGLRYEGTLRRAGKTTQGVCDELSYSILADEYYGKLTLPQGYIKGLRHYIGHLPIIMSGSGVIVENERGEVLLQRRRDNGCWSHAGGGMELGESCEETARRELFEETGLTAGSLELFGVFSGKETHYVYPHGDEVYMLSVVYICHDYSGELKAQTSEVRELRWFSIDALPEISPPDIPIYKAYLEKRKTDNESPNAFWISLDKLLTESDIVIERPKGTKHPRFDFTYPLDYGYLKNTTSMDGGGIDIWRGSLSEMKCDAVICTVDLLKRDSEIKLLIGCTEDEKQTALKSHNDSEHMKGVIIRRDNYFNPHQGGVSN
jgi:ribosomal-protein-alanine N-acetyltransferase